MTFTQIFLTLLVSGLSYIEAKPLNLNMKSTQTSVDSDAGVGLKTLGQLDSLHVVGISIHPSDSTKLLYADETSLYMFDKVTGESKHIAGAQTGGLSVDRKSIDGPGRHASFRYITRLVSRSSGLYVFDYDRLRKLDLSTMIISTVAILLDDETVPVMGVVSHDESYVYWYGSGIEGHFVMKAPLAGQNQEAQLLVAGPTKLGYMEVSLDGSDLFLSDIDMQMIEKVRVSNGEVTFVTEYGSTSFYPGSLAVVSDQELLAVDRSTRSIKRFQLSSDVVKESAVCEAACMQAIRSPYDVIADKTGNVYILDTRPHPEYPTYQFFIKEVQSQTEVKLGREELGDSSTALKYSNRLKELMRQYKFKLNGVQA